MPPLPHHSPSLPITPIIAPSPHHPHHLVQKMQGESYRRQTPVVKNRRTHIQRLPLVQLNARLEGVLYQVQAL